MSPRALRHSIGQLLMAGFHGTELPVELRSLAREFSLGGIILFKRNVVEPEQVAEIARQAGELEGDLPAWVAVDQEGGRVARLKRPFTEWPPLVTLGRAGDDDLARRFARALAAELLAVGVTLDFAPVIEANGTNPAIGDRAIANDVQLVGRLGAIIIEEFQRAGLCPCAKHFPGHGDTTLDPHHDLPILEYPPDRLRAVEFEPFRAAIRAGVASIMTCHALVPAFDEERPATLSPHIVQPLLRGELGYDGVVFTDDLDMKAVSARFPIPDAVVAAVSAGCDGVLVCSGDIETQAAALEALIHAIEDERVPYKRVEEALARMAAMKTRFLAQPVSPASVRGPLSGRALRRAIGLDAHAAIAEEMARHL